MKRIVYFIILISCFIANAFSQVGVEAGKYKLTVKPISVYHWGNGESCGDSQIKITAHYKEGNPKIFDGQRVNIDSRETKTDFRTEQVIFEPTNLIEKIELYSKRNWRVWSFGWHCNTERESHSFWNIRAADYPFIDRDVKSDVNDKSEGIDAFTTKLNIKIEPEKVDIYIWKHSESKYIKNNSGELPTSHQVKLAATKGFPNAVYAWEYSVNDEGYNPLPSQIAQGPEVSFSATELLGAARIGTLIQDPSNKVNVRIRSNGKVWSTISLSLLLSAPNFTSVQATNETCPDRRDGKLRIVLDRDTFPNEYISFKTKALNELNPGEEPEYPLDGIPMVRENGRTFLFNGLPTGNYHLKIYGYFQSEDRYTYTSEQFGFGKIESITPITFKVDSVNNYCKGNNEGKLRVTNIAGGTKPYTVQYKLRDDAGDYLETYSTSDNFKTVENLYAGLYIVKIVDYKACASRDSILKNIKEPEEKMKLEITDLNPSPSGAQSGFAEVKITAADNRFFVTWVDNSGHVLKEDEVTSTVLYGTEFLTDIDGLAAGNYKLYAKGAITSCQDSIDVEIPETPAPRGTIEVMETTSCTNTSDGKLVARIKGGTPYGFGMPYLYRWYSLNQFELATPIGSNDSILHNIPHGKYLLKVTDADDLEATIKFTFNQGPVALTAIFSTEPASCTGVPDGKSTVHASGGTAPYTYDWLGESVTTDTISGLLPGTYSVKITDSKGCNSTFQTTVSPGTMQVRGTVSNASCTDMTDGKISLQVTGGVSPYTYDWSNSSTNATIEDLAPGDYSVRVTDNNGCYADADYEVTKPTPVVIEVEFVNPLSNADLEDGAIGLFVKGGTPPYRAIWKDESNNSLGNSSFSKRGEGYITALRNLGEGTYYLELHDANYTSALAKDSLNSGGCISRDSFIITKPDPLTVYIEPSGNISCPGSADAVLIGHAAGGVPRTGNMPYNYYWYKVEENRNVPVTGNDSVLTSLSSGQYILKITDYNNSTAWSTPYIIPEKEPLTVDFRIDSVTCFGFSNGRISAASYGGTFPHSYQWSNGGTGQTISDIPVGTYSLKVTDTNGCSVESQASVFSPDSITIRATTFKPTCFGDSNGKIELSVTGGIQPYLYSWKANEVSVSPIREDMISGTHPVTITDANGCEMRDNFFLPQPEEVKVNVQQLVQPRGFGFSDGAIHAVISGGTPAYLSQWSSPDGNSFQEQPLSVQPLFTVSGITNCKEGSYFIWAEDANAYLSPTYTNPGSCGCVDTLTIYLPQPDPLEADIEETKPVSCNGDGDGTITVHARGGVKFTQGLPYKYQWYKVEGNSDIAFSVNDSTLSRLIAGRYKVKITDANNIVVVSDTFELADPLPLSLSFDKNEVKCSGDKGWIEALPQGGTLPYSCEWSNGSTVLRLDSILKGKYFVSVTDAHGCEITGNTQLKQPGGIEITAKLTHPTCYQYTDGHIELEVVGGLPPYSYHWENNAEALSHTQLAEGVYSFTIEDSNGCSKEAESYTLKHPGPVIVDLGDDRIICKDQVAKVASKADDPESTYRWYNVGTSALISQDSVAAITQTGTYKLEMTTSKGCKGEDQIYVRKDEEVIVADFVMATHAPIEENLVLVNISKPASQRMEWIIPEGEGIRVVHSETGYLEIAFDALGYYTLGMRAFQGDCEETTYRTVQVMRKDDIPGYDELKGTFLREFSIAANPNNGQFQLKLELGEKSDAQVVIVDSGTGKVIEQRGLRNSSIYREDFNLNVAQGVYILKMVSTRAQSSLKIIIK